MDLDANLGVFSAVEIINLIASGARTGSLTVVSHNDDKGVIYFDEGVPVHAEYKKTSGIEAIYNLAVVNRGTIGYSNGDTIREHTIEAEETAGLIHNIEKRKIEFDKIMSSLPPFDAILEKRAEGVKEDVALRKTDWTIIRLVNGKRNINHIIRDSNLPILVACHSLEWLLEKGLIFDKTVSERLIRDLETTLNNILDVFSVKGTNTKDWYEFLKSTLDSSNYETVSGMVEFTNDRILVNSDAVKILTHENIDKIKDVLYNNSKDKAKQELGNMIAGKKYKELMSIEGESK